MSCHCKRQQDFEQNLLAETLSQDLIARAKFVGECPVKILRK